MSLTHNLQDTIAQVIEGEAILITPQSGVYYSLNGLATWIWEQFTTVSTAEAVGHSLQSYFPQESGIAQDVQSLVQQWQEEKLLVDGESSRPWSAAALPATYAKPEMQTFRDPGDLLALDPPAPGLAEVTWGGG